MVRYSLNSNREGFPRVSGGTVAIAAGPRHYHFNLESVLPIRTIDILLPSSARDGCGATQPLAMRGRYAVIEAVWAEKGCRPTAVFIDVTTGQVADAVDFDHRWNHRFDVVSEPFIAKRIRVDSVDRIVLAQSTLKSTENRYQFAGTRPWDFALIHGREENGKRRLLAAEFWHDMLPAVGSDVYVGILRGHPPYSAYYPDEHVLRFSAADDARYAALQTPTPEKTARALRREQWFEISAWDVEQGQLSAAVDAMATMLRYEDDARLYRGESDDLRRCRAMVAEVRAGHLSIASARAQWQYGCQPEAAMTRSLESPKP